MVQCADQDRSVSACQVGGTTQLQRAWSVFAAWTLERRARDGIGGARATF
jgi:hypothetical protein